MKPIEPQQPEEITEIGEESMLLCGQWLNPDPALPEDPTKEQLIDAGFVNRSIPVGGANCPQIEHLRLCARQGLVLAFEAAGRGNSTLMFTKPSQESGAINFQAPDPSAS